MDTFEYMQLMKKQKEEGLDKKDIVKLNPSIENDKAFISNDLIKAIFHKKGGTYTAIQLLMYIASRDESNTIKKGEYYHIRIDLDDFISKYKSTKSTLYRHLDNIQSTIVTFYDKPNKSLWEKISLIAKQEKITRSIIQVDMHEKIYSKIKQTTNFTPLNTTNFQSSLSYNTLRVLILCGMINNYDTPRKEFGLEELNFLFETNYKNLYEFDRHIFKKAKVELDEYSNLSFESERLETLELAKGRPKLRAIRITTFVNNDWNDNEKFIAFRKFIREQYKPYQDIIYAPSIDRILTLNEDGLLMVKDGKVLSREKAVKWWNYIHDNKNKRITPELDLQ